VRGNSGDAALIYIGDLHGKLWKLKFTGVGSSDWNISKLIAFDKDPGSGVTPIPFFIAKDGSNNVQPITMAPSIAFGPTQNSYYVMFGTGKYMETADKSSTAQQSVYGLFDNGTTITDSDINTATSVISGRGRLRVGTVSTGSAPYTVTAASFKWGRATSDSDTTQRSGWYFDFGTSGERQVSDFQFQGSGNILFASLFPGASGGATNTCTAAGGGGHIYDINFLNGNGVARQSEVGITAKPLIFELPELTTYSQRDSSGRRWKNTSNQNLDQGAKGIGLGSTKTIPPLATGRLSWRRINNYQDLRNAP
jgi:type IV pilus assembly protein PilY1